MGFSGATGEGDLRGIRAVGKPQVLRGFACGLQRLGVRNGNLVVVPDALLADECKVKLGIERGNRDIEAVDLLGKPVGVGDGVSRGL